MGPRARGRSTSTSYPGGPLSARRAGSSPSLASDLPADFQVESLFHERRVTIRLSRRDGATRAPLHLAETGCRLSGTLDGRPFDAVLDDPDSGALRRSAGSLAAALAEPQTVTGAGLHERVHRLAPRILAVFDHWEREAAAACAERRIEIASTKMEATLARGVITAARARDGSPFLGARDERTVVEGRLTITIRSGARLIGVEVSRWADMAADSGSGAPPGWEGAAAEAVARAADLLEAAPPPAMEAPVVFSPEAAGVLLHEICGHLLEGDLVALGASPFARRFGEKVAAETLTLLDHPRLPGGRVRLVVDDEGTETRANVLIESGILRGGLTDARTAALSGGVSSGNARRESYRFPALPRMTNLVVPAGSTHPDDLLKRVARGLYATRLGRGQVDPRRGEFRLEVEAGRHIEGGRMTRPVAGAILVGSCVELLSSIDAVGADARLDAGAGACIKEDQIVPVGQSTPSLRAARVRILPGVAP